MRYIRAVSLYTRRHRARRIVATLSVIAVWGLGLWGCSAADSGDVCEAGRVATCPCAAGTEGIQTCVADGSEWGACACDSGGQDASSADAGGGGAELPDAGPDDDGGPHHDGHDAAEPGDGGVDSSPSDAAAGGGPLDTCNVEPAPEVEDQPAEESVLSATITAPVEGTVIEEGQSVTLIGVVTDSVYDSEELTATWLSDQLGILWEGTPDAGGWVQLEHTFAAPMQHTLTLRVENPLGASKTTTRALGVCTYGAVETFDAPLASTTWKTYGDAYWDSGADGGWLEMTGNLQSKQGAIFNIAEPINPGNVEIQFSIWTGEGMNSGADGFAMSVINTDDIPTLETIINTAGNGGCLGYGVSGPCGPMTITAFHIEFDTWHNANDPITDPIPENHVAITLDGDPGNHYLVAAVPSLEDSQWHDITVITQGTYITVELDGAVVIADDIPAFKFHGGYVGFSGTTGWASNYHRFDNLAVLQECLVP